MSTITIPSYDVVFRIGGAAHLTACLGETQAMEVFSRLSRDPAVSGLEIRDGETGEVVKRREATGAGVDALTVQGCEVPRRFVDGRSRHDARAGAWCPRLK